MHMVFNSQQLNEFCLELLVQAEKQSLEMCPKLWEV